MLIPTVHEFAVRLPGVLSPRSFKVLHMRAGVCSLLGCGRWVFFLHGRSVLGMPDRRNPEMFAIQGVSQ